jgi:hypothetical protein
MSHKFWLALAALTCTLSNRAGAQEASGPTFTPLSTPVVQLVDNNHQPDNCHSGVMGGGSIYILRPYINDNIAFITTTGIGTATLVQQASDFDWNFHVAPAVWLGWSAECGVGFRARYFQFDQDSEPLSGVLSGDAAASTVITAPAGLSPLLGTPPRGFQSPGVLLQGGAGQDLLTARSSLKIQTIDGEATYAHEWCSFGTMFTIGGRWLQMRQNYAASLQNIPVAGTSEISTLDAGHNFHGGGPTASWTARWQIGRSGLAIFGTARGSFLIGHSSLNAIFTETIIDPVNGNQLNQATSESRENLVLPVGELEGGFEYSRTVGHARLFFRGAIVNHTYFDAGTAASRSGNLSLFGGQASIGVNY